jgi:hypothetical protein
MYTSVALFSPVKQTLIVPRKAVHQGRIYIASADNLLEIKDINILFQQGDIVVLDGKKDAHLIGKNIIVSDVIPVMEGLPLKTILANDYEEKLAVKALGKSATIKNGTSK